jgi:hypothetical protein
MRLAIASEPGSIRLGIGRALRPQTSFVRPPPQLPEKRPTRAELRAETRRPDPIAVPVS